MRPFLAVLALLPLSPAQSQPPSPTKTEEARSKQKEGTAKQEQVRPDKVQAKGRAVVINQYYSQPENRNESKDENREDGKASADKFIVDALLVVSTFLLFLATVALCYVAWLQLQTMKAHKQSLEAMATHLESGLKETRMVAHAARDSAKASRATAKGIINSERAWVVVERFAVPTFQRPIAGAPPPGPLFSFDLKNFGRTPARLTGPFMYQIDLILRNAKLPDAPDFKGPPYYPYGQLLPEHGRILVPRRRSGFIDLLPQEPIDELMFDSIEQGNRKLYVYASMKYFDSFKEERELRFCYRYIPIGGANLKRAWILDGPPEYNKHT